MARLPPRNSALADLKQRLANTRFPLEAVISDWSQGVPPERQKRLIDYWQHSYDRREAERILNGFGQYRTLIDGLGIHFLHVRSPHHNPCRSTSRSASRISGRSSSARPAAGRKRRTATWSTSITYRAAATSPRSSSRNCGPMSCESSAASSTEVSRISRN
ncbi:epoxide hydrolase N-terminal domain-containing protein [Actinomadura sp. 6N118]|uniref:epoxide hydrolase N-terminal domain-containing protein n=1 Tax=Actinomadura sp. 6N118 TaxID=3375151 RepID=UPI003798746B